MSRTVKVYLPKWAARVALAALGAMWLFVSYMVFLAPGRGSDPGLGGWIVMSLILASGAVLVVLLGRRRLPVYVVEVEDDAEGDRG